MWLIRYFIRFLMFIFHLDSIWPVLWRKKTHLNDTSIVQSHLILSNSLMVFESLDEKDFGEYTCSSSNHLNRSEIRLIISRKAILKSSLLTYTLESSRMMKPSRLRNHRTNLKIRFLKAAYKQHSNFKFH